MHTVGAFEAKTHLSRLIEEVCRTGEPVIVQKRGRSMAIIEPYDKRASAARQEKAADLLDAFREIREHQPRKVPETLRELIEMGRN